MTDDRRNEAEPDARGSGAWIAAAILIAVGVVFLLRNLGYALPGNWWALFLLIPAAGSLAGAFRLYRQAGGYTPAMNGLLITALVFIALTAVFLLRLDLDWGIVWPVVLILIGLAALARTYWRR